MSKLMKVTFKLLDLIDIFVMTFTMPVGVLAAPPAQDPAPAIMTDKTDYLPGETVNVSGLEFAAGNYFLDAAYPDGSTVEWGPVVVDETLVFAAASPAPVTAAGTYGLTAFAEDHTTVIAPTVGAAD